MASVSLNAESARDRVGNVLTTDFCPWANRYVYWLKEPIGWFVIALAMSVLVGLHVSTVGWVLASVLASVIVIGMIWPWIVVRAAHCRLAPAVAEVHEDDECDLVLSVRNRWPLPLWGLAIEGYLDRHGDDARPTIALACVPTFSDAAYRLRVTPQLRGRYPDVTPQIACSMPFGIWTARRRLAGCAPLTVFPRVCRIEDEPELKGGRVSEAGEGLRAGQAGEPLGVREFRSGDRLRNMHWVHTARTGTLTVCERGGPQQQQVDVVLDATLSVTYDSHRRLALRQTLAQRVRVAASLALALHGRHVPIRLLIGEDVIAIAPDARGRRRLLTALADVPADGLPANAHLTKPASGRMTLLIGADGDAEGGVGVRVDRGGRPHWQRRPESAHDASLVRVTADAPLQRQLARFWREANHRHVHA